MRDSWQLCGNFYFVLMLRSFGGVSPGRKRAGVRQRRPGCRFAVRSAKSLATYVHTSAFTTSRWPVWGIKQLLQLSHLSPSRVAEEVTYRWIYNEFPLFLHTDRRRFVSQKTGNLYISKVEAQDAGNYSCFVSSPVIGKSVFSKFIPLIPLPPDEGQSEEVQPLKVDGRCLLSAMFDVCCLCGAQVRGNTQQTSESNSLTPPQCWLLIFPWSALLLESRFHFMI